MWLETLLQSLISIIKFEQFLRNSNLMFDNHKCLNMKMWIIVTLYAIEMTGEKCPVLKPLYIYFFRKDKNILDCDNIMPF